MMNQLCLEAFRFFYRVSTKDLVSTVAVNQAQIFPRLSVVECLSPVSLRETVLCEEVDHLAVFE